MVLLGTTEPNVANRNDECKRVIAGARLNPAPEGRAGYRGCSLSAVLRLWDAIARTHLSSTTFTEHDQPPRSYHDPHSSHSRLAPRETS